MGWKDVVMGLLESDNMGKMVMHDDGNDSLLFETIAAFPRVFPQALL